MGPPPPKKKKKTRRNKKIKCNKKNGLRIGLATIGLFVDPCPDVGTKKPLALRD